MKINPKYIFAAGAVGLLILIATLAPDTPPQFYNTENPDTHFYIEYRNEVCTITSKVRGEDVDLTQHTGVQKGVTGKVVYLKNLDTSTGCKLTKNQQIQKEGFRAPFSNSQFTTAFIVEAIAP